MAQLSLHFDPAADPFGHLTLRPVSARHTERRHAFSRNAIIGLGFIVCLTLSAIGLYIADQAAFNHDPSRPDATASMPLDYE